MPFDPKTKTIHIANQADFIASSGALFLNELREDGGQSDCPSGLATDWGTVEAWLGCQGRDLTASDYERFGNAWRSYMARGIAPSLSLEDCFKTVAAKAKQESWPLTDIPNELVRVFERLLATDTDIKSKKAADALRIASMLQAREKPEKTESSPQQARMVAGFLQSLSRNKRAIIALSIFWGIYVSYRTADRHELVGVYLDKWDSNELLPTLIVPPMVLVIGFRIYKWVTSARS